MATFQEAQAVETYLVEKFGTENWCIGVGIRENTMFGCYVVLLVDKDLHPFEFYVNITSEPNLDKKVLGDVYVGLEMRYMPWPLV